MKDGAVFRVAADGDTIKTPWNYQNESVLRAVAQAIFDDTKLVGMGEDGLFYFTRRVEARSAVEIARQVLRIR